MRSGLRPLLILAALLSGGCYRYVPAGLDELKPGRDVRVRMTEEEADRFNGVLMPGTRDLEGRVVELNGDRVLLQVPIAMFDRGARVETLNQRLDVSRSGVLDVQLRQLDRTRTGLLVGAGIAIGGFVLAKSLGDGLSSGGDDLEPGGQDILVPIFVRLRW